ncbi:hypothetical protein [Halobaculum sp. EA56]|uniref:hypothetical protein n=1 Tax=Halobaculum sp. EA56 TaxID=3421648 RepID=UPI003EBA3D3F
MSEEHPSTTEDVSTATDEGAGTTGEAAAVPDAAGTDGRLAGDFTRYVNYVALAALVALALVAGIQFYGAVSRTINQWIVREYRSLFHAAFNLAVLLVAAAGISWQVRRLRG